MTYSSFYLAKYKIKAASIAVLREYQFLTWISIIPFLGLFLNNGDKTRLRPSDYL
ncbi:MAG: hypothetical protein ACPGXL_04895 [Chitinophagales bacterium]